MGKLRLTNRVKNEKKYYKESWRKDHPTYKNQKKAKWIGHILRETRD
jgi:hypothetical protein